jgi:aminoglycoside phosphotransferase (APT) family kinase protein
MKAMDEHKLKQALQRHLGFGVAVEGLQRLPGGASHVTWSLDALKEDGDRLPLILREGPDLAKHNPDSGQLDCLSEYRLLKAAETTGVPVPRIYFMFEPEDEVGFGYLMERIEGETIPRKILRDEAYAPALPLMAAQCGEILARIHKVDISGLSFLRPVPPDMSPAGQAIGQFQQILTSLGEPHPAFELGLRWLEECMPPADRITLVHGDFRNGNLIVGPEGVRSVLDWELSHIGDPMEDLGWLCVKSWRFGVNHQPVGGFGTYDELFAAYEKASGIPVDCKTVHFWEVFGNIKWGVVCIVQAMSFLMGVRRTVEHAALGRRICETEYDVMNLIS